MEKENARLPFPSTRVFGVTEYILRFSAPTSVGEMLIALAGREG